MFDKYCLNIKVVFNLSSSVYPINYLQSNSFI